MKDLKRYLKKIDIFGVPLTFRYKSKDKYSTSLGGFVLILFCILVLYLGIYNFTKFINRKNFKTIYYTVNIPKTDMIKLEDTKAIFSLGLDCTSKGRFKAQDVFNLEARYVNYTKTQDGIYDKNKTLLSSHFCRHEDFFNNHNESFNRLTLELCIKSRDGGIDLALSVQHREGEDVFLPGEGRRKHVEEADDRKASGRDPVLRRDGHPLYG